MFNGVRAAHVARDDEAHAAAVIGETVEEHLARLEGVALDLLQQPVDRLVIDAVLSGVEVSLLPGARGGECFFGAGGHVPGQRGVLRRVVRQLRDRGGAEDAHQLRPRGRAVDEDAKQVLGHDEGDVARRGSVDVRVALAASEEGELPHDVANAHAPDHLLLVDGRQLARAHDPHPAATGNRRV